MIADLYDMGIITGQYFSKGFPHFISGPLYIYQIETDINIYDSIIFPYI